MKKLISSLIWLFSLLIIFPLFGTSQNEIGRPFITNYHAVNYKAHAQNWSVTQDDRGIIYIGNGDGILTYDGKNWELITLPNKVTARTLEKSPEGIIYAGSINEFGYLQPNTSGSLEYISLSKQLNLKNFGTVWDIFFLEGKSYFITNDFIIQYDSLNVKTWETETTFVKPFIFKKELYIQDSKKGLLKLDNESLVSAPDGKAFIGIPLDFGIEIKDYVALGSDRKGFLIYDGEKLKHIPGAASEYFINNSVYRATKYKDQLVASTNIGGCVFVNKKGEILRTINVESGLQSNNIHFGYIDNQNNLWFALNKGIAKCEIATPISYWNQDNGLVGMVLNTIRYNDYIYIATHQGIFFIKDNKINRLNYKLSQSWWFLDYKIPNSNKHQLLVSTNQGVYQLNGENLKLITTERVGFTMKQSRFDSSIVYVGFSDNIGVIKYEKQKFKFLGHIPNTGFSIRSIYENEDSSIWATTFRHEVTKIIPSNDILNPKDIKYYGLQKGLPSLKNVLVHKFKDEPVFSTEKGIYKYHQEPDSFIVDSTFSGIFTGDQQDIFSFVEGKNNDIWISQLYKKSGSIGVASKNPDNTYNWSTSILNRIPEMMVLSFYLDEFNNVWIGGSEGLFKFDTKVPFLRKNNIKAFIRSVKTNNDSTLFGGNFYIDTLGKKVFSNIQNKNQIHELEYKNNSLTFSFAAPDFYNESEMVFQMFLDGYDKEWSNWSQKSFKEYTNLPEGNYSFKVKAKNMYGEISQVASYDFSILPPWYRSPFALVMYIFIFVFIIWISIKIYTKRLKAEKEKLEFLIREKTKNLHEINTLLEEQQADLEIKQEEITAQAYNLKEINVELEEHKENLEKLVQERTIALEKAKEKAEQSDILKSAFLANMSHEIRTPMNAIIGFSHLLNDPEIGNENKSEIIAHISHNSDTLLHLIDDIIDISKIEAGQLEIHEKECKINNILNELLLTYQEKKKHYGKETLDIILKTSNSEKEFAILSDPIRVQQVIINLMDNALKFTNTGIIEFGYNIEELKNNPHIIFYVKDTGIGLSDNDKKKIFTRFTKLENDRRKLYRGAGLGLAICKNIADLLNGEIWVESKQNVGSQFYFKIPFIELKSENKLFENNLEKNKINWYNKTVLITEDEDSNFQFIEMVLSSTDIKIIRAKTGKEAIEILEKNSIDIILMDIKMPEMDGLEATKIIRSKNKDIPIIAQTAYAMEDDEINSIAAGCNNYISKPIKKQKLIQLMNRYI